tara:strand:- start:295 stop:411 length:117 start_codon:yes stop_codon:yes gene_type:complete
MVEAYWVQEAAAVAEEVLMEAQVQEQEAEQVGLVLLLR